MLLFNQGSQAPKQPTRPKLPKGTVVDFEIGFLFNFVTSRSANFDLEPVLIYKRGNAAEYKRISLQVNAGLAYLQPLDESFYEDIITFSDNRILAWMTATGNKFIRDADNGTWACASAREQKNLRKHYRDLLLA